MAQVYFPQPTRTTVPNTFDMDIKHILLNNSKYATLVDLLDANKGIKKSGFKFELNDGSIAFIIMIHCHNDATLIKLAEDCNFPRGFPILYIPGKFIQVFGFYPKFDNDERTQKTDDTFFDNAISLSGSLKYSGFLGGVLPFRYNGETYTIFTSKNSADSGSIYINEINNIIKGLPNVLSMLVDLSMNNSYLYGEVLSLNDQVHGYAIIKDAFVVTCMGISNIYDLTLPEVSPIYPNNFSTFYDFAFVDEFCKKHCLSRDGHFIADGPTVSNLMRELENMRDYMTYSKLMNIIIKFSSWIPCTSIHSDYIASTICEGLVMKVNMKNGTTKIIKYKFAAYTIRTMLYRTILETPIIPTNAINRFTSIWCLTEQGRNQWTIMAKGFFVAERMKLFPQQENSKIAKHIYIADMLDTLSIDEISAIAIQYDKLFSIKKVPIIIVTGPIGIGKTTISEKIFDQVKLLFPNTKFSIVDCDKLDIGCEKIMQLGKERSPYTISYILNVIRSGIIPIISTGSGVLFNNNNCILFQKAIAILGVELDLHLFIPRFDTDSINFLPMNSYVPEIISNIYKNERTNLLVSHVVIERIKRGEWQEPEKQKTADFAKVIAGKSSRNLEFALKLSELATTIYTFPVITSDNMLQSFALPTTFQIIEDLSVISSVQITQLRACASLFNLDGKLVKMAHSTLEYFNSSSTMNIEDINSKLTKLPSSPISGTIATFTSIDKIHSIIVAYPDIPLLEIHTDGSTHFTIDSGKHIPMHMKSVISALRIGDKTISLLQREGDTYIEYSLTPSNIIHVNIVFDSIFYL